MHFGINAFLCCSVRCDGEQCEMNFCDQKSLNMQTLRMTCEAKNQLRDILTNIGFPEESLLPQSFNFTGPDNQLDVVGVCCLSFLLQLLLAFPRSPCCPKPSASLAWTSSWMWWWCLFAVVVVDFPYCPNPSTSLAWTSSWM